jgi:hypothetical protein
MFIYVCVYMFMYVYMLTCALYPAFAHGLWQVCCVCVCVCVFVCCVCVCVCVCVVDKELITRETPDPKT